MMKKVITLFISLFISYWATAQYLVDTPRIVTALTMNLAGDIDSVAELRLAVKVLAVGATMQVNGDSGNKVVTIPDTSLTITGENAWKFDTKGRLLSEVHRNTDNKKGELLVDTAKVYSYEEGRLKSVVTIKENYLADSASYIYRNHNLSMQEQFDSKGKYRGRIQYFTNRGRQLSTISYKNAGLELIKMTKYWYDDKGFLTSATYHDNFQRLLLTQKFDVSTDSAGNIHTMIFDYAIPDVCTGMKSYLLNDAGNHLEDVLQDEKGNVLYISTAKLNDYNHVVEQTIFTDLKKVITCTYEYDSHKNWTMKRIYHNGEPHTFVRRTIIYRE